MADHQRHNLRCGLAESGRYPVGQKIVVIIGPMLGIVATPAAAWVVRLSQDHGAGFLSNATRHSD